MKVQIGGANTAGSPPLLTRCGDALGGIDHRFQAEVEPDGLDVQRPVAFAILRRELAERAKRDIAPRIEVAEQRMDEARDFVAIDGERHHVSSP